MNVRIVRKAAGSYRIATAKSGIVLGSITNFGKRGWWAQSNGTPLQASFGTLAQARQFVHQYYEFKDFCLSGCGEVVNMEDQYCKNCQGQDLSGIYWDRANGYRVEVVRRNPYYYTIVENYGREREFGQRGSTESNVNSILHHIDGGVLTKLVGHQEVML